MNRAKAETNYDRGPYMHGGGAAVAPSGEEGYALALIFKTKSPRSQSLSCETMEQSSASHGRFRPAKPPFARQTAKRGFLARRK
jgi:hypothetical protein